MNRLAAAAWLVIVAAGFPAAAAEKPTTPAGRVSAGTVPASAYAAYCMGYYQADQGNYLAAVDYLEEALKSDPAAADVHSLLGTICLERLRQPLRAEEHFEAALKQNAQDFASHYGLARLRLAAGEWEKGLAEMNAAIATPLAQDSPDMVAAAYCDLATAAEDLRKFDVAVDYYLQAAKKAANPIYPLVRLGHLYRRMNQNEDALKVFLQIKRVVPHPEVIRELAEIYQSLGMWGEALGEVEAYMRAPQGPGEQDFLVRSAAELAAKCGRFEQADAYQRKLLGMLLAKMPKENPGPDLCEATADAYLRLGKPEDARPMIEKAEAGAAGAMRLRLQVKLAGLYERMGQYDEAAAKLRAAVSAAEPKQSIPLRVQLSAVLEKANKRADAEAALKEIASLPNGAAVAHAELGRFRGRGGDVDGAAAELRQAIDQSEGEQSRGFRIQLGMMYADAKRSADAEKVLVETHRMFPNDADVDNALGWFYAERGEKLDEARALAEAALKLEPDNAAFLDTLGWVHFKQGHPRLALDPLLRAAGRMEDGSILDHVGDVYLSIGQADMAKMYWAQSLRVDPTIKGVREKLDKLK